MYANFSALSCYGKEAENRVPWPWVLIYDLEILWVSSGCRNFFKLRAAVHELSCKQRKNSDENNTLRTVIIRTKELLNRVVVRLTRLRGMHWRTKCRVDGDSLSTSRMNAATNAVLGLTVLSDRTPCISRNSLTVTRALANNNAPSSSSHMHWPIRQHSSFKQHVGVMKY